VNSGPYDLFRASLERAPQSPAFEHEGETFSYAALGAAAGGISSLIAAGISPIAWLGERGPIACCAILGVLGAGLAYLPLSPKSPVSRLAAQLRLAGVHTLLAHDHLTTLASQLQAEVPALEVIFLGRHSLDFSAAPVRRPPGELSYVLFTSGSTGTPKAIGVRTESVAAYLAHIGRELALEPQDRVSQTFELTFDLSVHDLFATWAAGACVVALPESRRLFPADFIRSQRISVWFSTPSTISFARELGALTPGSLPSLRLSLFCGEALTLENALAWRAAAQSSALINLYGPTETTVAISLFRWEASASAPEARHGLLPIGRVFPGHEWKLRDRELLLSGPQVLTSYFLGETSALEDGWYPTGDLVEEHDGELYFLGRNDSQWKIRGHRAEAAEIEAALLRAGCVEAKALPWPPAPGPSESVYAFVHSSADKETLLAACRAILPEPLVPIDLFFGPLPRNANGKVDTAALRERMPR